MCAKTKYILMALVLLPSYLLAQFKTHCMHLLLHDQNKKKAEKASLIHLYLTSSMYSWKAEQMFLTL